MKKYNPLYYLLFVLLIMGAFAAMAQNDYGIKILGGVSLAFSLLFGLQLILLLITKRDSNKLDIIELFSLVVLSLILTMRVYYIRFEFVEVIFGLAGFTLAIVYAFRLFKSYSDLKHENRSLALMIIPFYGSIVFYTISMTVVPFAPLLIEPTGGLAFGLLIIFVIRGFFSREVMVEGEKISVFAFVTHFKDRSIVLLSIFLLFTSYMGLTKVGLIPRMYSDQFPQAYFELVNRAESGEEKAVDGKYKHEEFKQHYDRFLNRHVDSGKK